MAVYKVFRARLLGAVSNDSCVMSERRGAWSVTNNERTARVGIVASSLDELISKSVPRLKLTTNYSRSTRSNSGYKCYVSESGTLVSNDEYLFSLKNHTSLVIVERGDTMKKEFEHELSKQLINPLSCVDVNQIFYALLKTPDAFQEFLRKIESLNCNAHFSLKEEDPMWFKDIKSSVNSKEEHMSNNAKQRIYSYLQKVKTALTKDDIYTDPSNYKIKQKIDAFIEVLNNNLSENKWNKSYFDRKAEKNKICDNDGLFKCGGTWNSEACDFQHTINPYSNYEKRIFFSTWNLDHNIELSRSIIPSIKNEIIQNNCHCENYINSLAEYYYDLILTTKNLKLVSIVCHDKKSHDSRILEHKICMKCN